MCKCIWGHTHTVQARRGTSTCALATHRNHCVHVARTCIHLHTCKPHKPVCALQHTYTTPREFTSKHREIQRHKCKHPARAHTQQDEQTWMPATLSPTASSTTSRAQPASASVTPTTPASWFVFERVRGFKEEGEEHDIQKYEESPYRERERDVREHTHIHTHTHTHTLSFSPGNREALSTVEREQSRSSTPANSTQKAVEIRISVRVQRYDIGLSIFFLAPCAFFLAPCSSYMNFVSLCLYLSLSRFHK